MLVRNLRESEIGSQSMKASKHALCEFDRLLVLMISPAPESGFVSDWPISDSVAFDWIL